MTFRRQWCDELTARAGSTREQRSWPEGRAARCGESRVHDGLFSVQPLAAPFEAEKDFAAVPVAARRQAALGVANLGVEQVAQAQGPAPVVREVLAVLEIERVARFLVDVRLALHAD